MIQLKYPVQELYEKDYALWIDKTLEQLRSQDKEHLDWEHLAEKIEDLGCELRHKVDR